MTEDDKFSSMESWLHGVRMHVIRRDSSLLPYLEECENEARFGRRFIDADLAKLAAGAAVLELGAGLLLLSCQLVREGFNVTALEPIGEGFTHFERLRKLVLEVASATGCVPRMLTHGAEALWGSCCYDFVFSVNVMEHVGDVATVIAKVGSALRPLAGYHFTCPNYLFPYEPHFNIPTLFSKKLTERVFRNFILRNSRWPDPSGAWNSINWINGVQLSQLAGRFPDLKIKFNPRFLVSTLERIASDEAFASRRSGWVRLFILGLIQLRIHRLARFIPARLQPLMDCTLTKRGEAWSLDS